MQTQLMRDDKVGGGGEYGGADEGRDWVAWQRESGGNRLQERKRSRYIKRKMGLVGWLVIRLISNTMVMM